MAIYEVVIDRALGPFGASREIERVSSPDEKGAASCARARLKKRYKCPQRTLRIIRITPADAVAQR